MRGFQLLLRFVLELCALAALAYAGWQTSANLWARLLVAIALPLVAAVVWGQWVAPRARRPIPDPLRLVPEWLVFGGATVALALTGHPILAAALAVLAAGNRFALHLLHVTTGGATEQHPGPRIPG
ncbi:YrdB family protein [Actinoplanes sp. NPDC004185]